MKSDCKAIFCKSGVHTLASDVIFFHFNVGLGHLIILVIGVNVFVGVWALFWQWRVGI